MFVDGFGLSGYRSFGSPLQRIAPLRKVTLVIGQNNSGKSNVLTFLAHHYGHAMRASTPVGRQFELEPLDLHGGGAVSREMQFSTGVRPDGPLVGKVIDRAQERAGDRREIVQRLVPRLYANMAAEDATNLAWWDYRCSVPGLMEVVPELRETLTRCLESSEWQALWGAITNQGLGNIAMWINETLPWVSPMGLDPPKVALVPAIRRVAEASESEDFSGLGLIDKLARLQDPSALEQGLRRRFDDITLFVQSVTENGTARLQIPYQRDTILVHLDGRTLPLERLGTGIHEVVILAAAATILEDHLVCIEEPELHLHPLLQKKLLRYLSESTSNQYLIATHSAHLLDTADATVLHVTHTDGASCVDIAATSSTRSGITRDLGYRPSDLFQANCVIWVEGPSDRIYLRHWIGSVASDLREGLHYTIMFYGGRLLRHLSADDEELEDFICLRRLNRQIAIVIDSDKPGQQASILATKSRVIAEFNAGFGHAWLTAGREIENYVPLSQLREAVRVTHPSSEPEWSLGQYEDLFAFDAIGVRYPDKVKIARQVASSDANLDILDLREQIEKMVSFVRAANGLRISA